MFEDIKNKRVLITGASGGIGSAMALLFADYGAHLGLHYWGNKKDAIELLRQVREKTNEAELFRADFLKSEAPKHLIKSFMKKFGGIDVLINNAGAAFGYAPFSKLSDRDWQNTFDLNVKAPFRLIKEVFPYMKKQSGGRIINISSVNVKYGGSGKSIHYVASKAALETITRAFAKEGAKDNILVNVIRCGAIDTPMRKKVRGYTEKDMKKRIEMIPLRRMGKPIDIARMALFLASEAGNFITGEIFTVAGGD